MHIHSPVLVRSFRFMIFAMQGFTYGVCPCTGKYESRSVEVRMTVGGSVVKLEQVPQGACSQCGSRVYKAEVIELLDALMKSSRTRTSVAA